MRKIFRRALTAFLIVIFALSAAIVGAKIQMYTATAEDYPSPIESPDISKQRALDKAIKKATKESGIYLKRDSRSVAGELTEDEITAITSNSWQLVSEPKYTREIINHSDDTQIIVWKVTVEVNVDDAELQNWIKRDDKEKSTIISQTREAQKASEENDRKVENLREQYKRATSQAEKDKIRKQMNDADRDFLANQKFEEGNKLYYAKDFNGAIKLYDEVLKFGEYSVAYNNRGLAYYNQQQYERAIQDYNKALELNPNDALAYYNRGLAYRRLNKHKQALADFDKCIQLVPNDYDGWQMRGKCYQALGDEAKAQADFAKAKQLGWKG